MRSLFRSGALALLLTGVCWLAVVIWWQSSSRQVSNADLALWFIALPVLLCVAVFGGLSLRSASRQEPAADAALADAKPSTPPPEAVAVRIPVRGVGLACAAGNDAEAALAALAGGEVQPGPAEDLSDRDGMPLRVARVDGLECSEVERWSREAGLELAQRSLRAFALLQDALVPLLQSLDSRDGEDPQPPKLRVRVLIPARWNEVEHAAAQRWCSHLLGRFGEQNGLRVASVLADDDGAFWREVTTWHRNYAQSHALLLLAMDSALDATELEELSASGKLFSAEHPDGRVPGEAAVALLVGDASIAERAVPPLAWLSSTTHLADDTAASRRRPAPALVAGLLSRLAAEAALDLAEVAALVGVGDGAPRKAVELAGSMNLGLPELDPVEDRVSIGGSLGDLGIVGSAVAASLAFAASRRDQRPILVVSLAGAAECSAACLFPVSGT